MRARLLNCIFIFLETSNEGQIQFNRILVNSSVSWSRCQKCSQITEENIMTIVGQLHDDDI